MTTLDLERAKLQAAVQNATDAMELARTRLVRAQYELFQYDVGKLIHKAKETYLGS